MFRVLEFSFFWGGVSRRLFASFLKTEKNTRRKNKKAIETNVVLLLVHSRCSIAKDTILRTKRLALPNRRILLMSTTTTTTTTTMARPTTKATTTKATYAEKAKRGIHHHHHLPGEEEEEKNGEEDKKNKRFSVGSSDAAAATTTRMSSTTTTREGEEEEEDEEEGDERTAGVAALAEKMKKETRVKDEDEGERGGEEEEDTTAARGENNDEDEVNLLAAKMLGDTHYAYGSFGYGYYTPLPDGTAIFTPAFVPPPVPWGYEHQHQHGGMASPTTGEGEPLQQYVPMMMTPSSEVLHQHSYYQQQQQQQQQQQPYEEAEEEQLEQQYYSPTPSEFSGNSIMRDIASAEQHFTSFVGEATAATFSSIALPPMSQRDAARAGKLRTQNGNGTNTNKKQHHQTNYQETTKRKPMINYGRGNSFLSLGESVRGPRFRNPERILSLGSPYKSLHEKLINPNPHEIFAGIDWSACKGFVCKSFSEDDIHKSIKYGKWSSTPRGNTKLSEAFQQQQQIHLSRNGGTFSHARRARGGGLSSINSCSKGSDDVNDALNENRSIAINDKNETVLSSTLKTAAKSEKKIPQRIFLLFSVNASGYFSGVAEMTSDVDFNKNETFWQREGKFNGSFDVEWLVAKDVPFHVFGRHLRIVDDRKIDKGETKRVTHSRDAQYVTPTVLRQCIELMLAYPSDNSLVKDFEFYDERERTRCESRERNSARASTSDCREQHHRTSVPVSLPKPQNVNIKTPANKTQPQRSSSESTKTKTKTTTTTTVVS